MARMNFTLFWTLALICLSRNAGGKAKSRTLSDVDKKLKLLNKPAVKSIKSEDGDIIDCVDIHKQPAFDNPALRSHVIQMKPSIDARTEKMGNSNQIFQTWQRSGTCPEGTIPIRRIRNQDLLRSAASLEPFGRKASHYTSNQKDLNGNYSTEANTTQVVVARTTPNRSTAYLVTVGYNYIGARGEINIWNPKVDSPDDFTTAQIWLRGGPGDNFESIESGWVVNPKLYGDTRTRFFAYWTKDAYKQTGCFDLTCSGFIQTSSQVALGAAIEPISSKSGEQFQVPVAIFMHVRIMDFSRTLKYPEWVGTWSDEPPCYSSLNLAGYSVEPVFYFGGPGGGRYADCP
ncbi:hypothetical protein SLEP1_g55536 [Rubroshorea leprosula]|uniref:Neprosin PEP catalytic domain-containing protein n=1 Tax=Rubroshorea leprosula TaxID=152421 RepID=A0AAV5MGU6_9ROSI|nr:hypothetical protein SLEP1_g55536 [Rubroshorea leprosula]